MFALARGDATTSDQLPPFNQQLLLLYQQLRFDYQDLHQRENHTSFRNPVQDGQNSNDAFEKQMINRNNVLPELWSNSTDY